MRHPEEVWKVLSLLPEDHKFRIKLAELSKTPLVEYLMLVINYLALDIQKVRRLRQKIFYRVSRARFVIK